MQNKEHLTILIEYLGCKVNNYESECVADDFINHGYNYFKNDETYPTVILINTCSVTHVSEAKDRKVIKRYRKQYPESILVVMGCYAQNHYELIAKELEADIVIGTSNRDKVYNLVTKYMENHSQIVLHDLNNSIKKYENLNLYNSILTTRAYLKIQDGCDNYCTYCLIPYIRGRSRSRKKEDIFLEVDRLIKKGFKEVILTGIDIGSYGHDLYKNYNFSDLLYDILIQFPNLYRLRISSIEESQIDDKFLKCLKEFPNIANHLHIPLQSGSKEILKKMNRKYDLDSFKRIVKKIREVRKDIAITTDVIVGFPGESEENFSETYSFCKEIQFSKIHVFPYSMREGTVAYRFENQVNELTKKLRVTRLLYLSDCLTYLYSKQFDGEIIEFLIENYDEKKKKYRAHSSNYLEFYIKSDKDIKGEVVKAKYKYEKKIDKEEIKKIFN